MRSWLWFSAFAAILGCGVRTASADVMKLADPAHCTVARTLTVVGSRNGLPDAIGAWTITIRNLVNTPVAGSTIVLDFSGCSDIRLACDQLTSVTGQALLNAYLYGVTNAQGQFTYYVQGASTASLVSGMGISSGTNAGVPCVRVLADGIDLGPVVVAADDVNGSGSPSHALDGSDVALVAAESIRAALGTTPRARDDFDFNGRVTGADVALLAQRVIAGVTQNTGAICP